MSEKKIINNWTLKELCKENKKKREKDSKLKEEIVTTPSSRINKKKK